MQTRGQAQTGADLRKDRAQQERWLANEEANWSKVHKYTTPDNQGYHTEAAEVWI